MQHQLIAHGARNAMSLTLPFHTVKPGSPFVFHRSDACPDGAVIEPVNWKAGDGNRPLCPSCRRIESESARARMIREHHTAGPRAA